MDTGHIDAKAMEELFGLRPLEVKPVQQRQCQQSLIRSRIQSR